MAYEVKWYIEDRVIYVRLYGQVTEGELDEVRVQTLSMFDNSKHPLHLINDNTQIESYPIGISALLKTSRRKRHENLGMSVMVSSNGIARYLVKLVYQVIGARISMCDTMEEALEILKKGDSTLDC